MKMVKTVKDKYDVIGLWSMIGAIGGTVSGVVAFIVNYCNRIVTPIEADPSKIPTSVLVVQISVYSAKVLLTIGLIGAVSYQLLNLKNRDDLPMWWALIWFEALAVISLFVLYFPGVFQSLLGLIFKG